MINYIIINNYKILFITLGDNKISYLNKYIFLK